MADFSQMVLISRVNVFSIRCISKPWKSWLTENGSFLAHPNSYALRRLDTPIIWRLMPREGWTYLNSELTDLYGHLSVGEFFSETKTDSQWLMIRIIDWNLQLSEDISTKHLVRMGMNEPPNSHLLGLGRLGSKLTPPNTRYLDTFVWYLYQTFFRYLK